MIVVVGGGVAGVACVQELVSLADDHLDGPQVTLITGRHGCIKTVDRVEKRGEIAHSVFVSEHTSATGLDPKQVRVIKEDVVKWVPAEKSLLLSDGSSVDYDKLCIATGARPIQTISHPYVVTLRDMDSIQKLQAKLADARRVLIVGNGGIATELAYELTSVEVVWAIRHQSIAASYFDKQAAVFFRSHLESGRPPGTAKREVRLDRYAVSDPASSQDRASTSGCALGPHWLAKLDQPSSEDPEPRKIHVIPDVEVVKVSSRPFPDGYTALLSATFMRRPPKGEKPWRVNVKFSNGDTLGADLVIMGIGVKPNSEVWQVDGMAIAEDNGILVDTRLRTSIPDVFAIGDVCRAKDFEVLYPTWSQIRLWSQARVMGIQAARVMVHGDMEPDIFFEIFTHVTSFFGYDVVLLGDFAGQNLKTPYDVHVRYVEGHEYVKILAKDRRVYGAVLVGDTTLAETLQNLILDQTDISAIEDDILNPDFDVEDYYD